MSQMTQRFTRRACLGAIGAGAAGLGGCLAGARPTASVLAAGSLAATFNGAVGPAFTDEAVYGYDGEFHGSAAVLRMVQTGQKQPDVVVSADTTVLRERLYPAVCEWDLVFASNALVIVYNPQTLVGRRLERGEPWHAVLATAEEPFARTDPELDPLGYRALQLFDLAARFYDDPDLNDALRSNSVVDPQEAHLLAGVATGQHPAAIAYRNMAHDRSLPARELPAALNFADPRLAEHYATATYTTEDGDTIPGRPIRYSATVPETAPDPAAGRAFVRFLARHPDRLTANGLTVPETLPRGHGDVPPEVGP